MSVANEWKKVRDMEILERGPNAELLFPAVDAHGAASRLARDRPCGSRSVGPFVPRLESPVQAVWGRPGVPQAVHSQRIAFDLDFSDDAHGNAWTRSLKSRMQAIAIPVTVPPVRPSPLRSERNGRFIRPGIPDYSTIRVAKLVRNRRHLRGRRGEGVTRDLVSMA